MSQLNFVGFQLFRFSIADDFRSPLKTIEPWIVRPVSPIGSICLY